MKKYKVLFCDLDGTLIKTISGETFPQGIWDMELRFDVLDAIKELSPNFVLIVSNQGGIESGFVNEDDFISKMEYVENSVKEYLNSIHAIVNSDFCKINNKTNVFRKPNIGMLHKFCAIYARGFCKDMFDKNNILMIGDASGKEGQWSDTDKKTAENFGIDYMDVEDFIGEYK